MPIPSKEEVLAYLHTQRKGAHFKDILAYFKIKGSERKKFGGILREMTAHSEIAKGAKNIYHAPRAETAQEMDNVGVIEVTGSDINNGSLLAKPVEWDEDKQGKMPRIEIDGSEKGASGLTPGDRILTRLEQSSGGYYTASIIRILGRAPDPIVGIITRANNGQLQIKPADKKNREIYNISKDSPDKVKEGDMVSAELVASRSGQKGLQARITKHIGHIDDKYALSLLSAHEKGLRTEFSHAALAETKGLKVPALGDREDLRNTPLVTIDGADARDYDDAVFAEKTEDGYHLIVAIADVSHYVESENALDKEALRRGNSTYFPDMVIPMLPEALSNGLCSLLPHEDRASIAVHLYINEKGDLTKFKFSRALIKSAARLTYEQVQEARDGNPDATTKPLMKTVIAPLYEVYNILDKARQNRGALDLDIPERKIVVNENNEMTGVEKRERVDSHKLIEECMILANVAAAKGLATTSDGVYRVHDDPDEQKLESVSEFAQSFGMSLQKNAGAHPKELNKIIKEAAKLPQGALISQMLLRSMKQARYDVENIGHFGLGLSDYTHFTSPIRRYSDLLVHRALIKTFNLGSNGLTDRQAVQLEEMSDRISQTERKSAAAEYSAVDRFTARYMKDKIGQVFKGKIRGMVGAGLFVELAENGADIFIPSQSLPSDRYDHHEDVHALIGRRHGLLFRMGADLDIKVTEADVFTGSMKGTIDGDALNDGADIPGSSFNKASKNGGNKHRGNKQNGGGSKKRRKNKRGATSKRNRGFGKDGPR